MWVIAEQENGQLMNVTFELLGAAKELCAKLEEKCMCGTGDRCCRRAAAAADCCRR